MKRLIGAWCICLLILATTATGQVAPESTAEIKGQQTEVQGQVMNLPGQTGDVKGQIGDVKGEILDLKDEVRDLVFSVQDVGGQTSNLDVKETKTEIRVDLAADVLFDFDKATLRPEAQLALKQAGDMIREHARGTVRIEGHTDAKGSVSYNQRLSERRAKAVKDWFLLNTSGLTDVNFVTQGYGARRPVAPNTRLDGSDDPEGRQKNRRVEIVIKK